MMGKLGGIKVFAVFTKTTINHPPTTDTGIGFTTEQRFTLSKVIPL